MADELTWDDAEELGYMLFERFPDTDPLTVHYTELLRWVREIPTFSPTGGYDEPTVAKLEEIRRAWAEEWRDRGGAVA